MHVVNHEYKGSSSDNELGPAVVQTLMKHSSRNKVYKFAVGIRQAGERTT